MLHAVRQRIQPGALLRCAQQEVREANAGARPIACHAAVEAERAIIAFRDSAIEITEGAQGAAGFQNVAADRIGQRIGEREVVAVQVHSTGLLTQLSNTCNRHRGKAHYGVAAFVHALQADGRHRRIPLLGRHSARFVTVDKIVFRPTKQQGIDQPGRKRMRVIHGDRVMVPLARPGTQLLERPVQDIRCDAVDKAAEQLVPGINYPVDPVRHAVPSVKIGGPGKDKLEFQKFLDALFASKRANGLRELMMLKKHF